MVEYYSNLSNYAFGYLVEIYYLHSGSYSIDCYAIVPGCIDKFSMIFQYFENSRNFYCTRDFCTHKSQNSSSRTSEKVSKFRALKNILEFSKNSNKNLNEISGKNSPLSTLWR